MLTILRKIQKKIRNQLLFGSQEHNFLSSNPTLSMYSIGKYSYGSPMPNLKADKFFCSIAEDVTIVLGREHRPDWVTTYPFNIVFDEFKSYKGHPATKGSVTIGNDVWIGTKAFILSGVTIGDGAVIGANSLVATDVEPYTIVAGNPAKVIRKRFNQETIDKLLKIKWWNWDIQRIKDNMHLLLSNKVDEFVEKNYT